MLNKTKWNQISFIKFLKKYEIGKYEDDFLKFKNKKIAFIGTSPITLLVANIYALFNAELTKFEKKEIGGAWQTTKYKKKHYPSSTHILMPNRLANDLLNLINIPNSPWTKKPYSINPNSRNISSFPKNKNEYDEFNMNDFSYGKKDFSSYLLEKLKTKKVNFYREKVSKIIETNEEIKICVKNINYSFDYVFLTPAANLNSIKIQKKIINPKYNNYLNKSLLMVLSKNFKFGSSFIHFYGKSPIREIQSFKDRYKKNIIIVKLSRQWKNKNYKNINSILSNIFRNNNFLSGSKKIKIEYNMKRMTPNTHKIIINKSERIISPLTNINMSDKKLNSTSQDISRLIGRKNFFYSLVKVIKNEK